jgi:hypothetical protein
MQSSFNQIFQRDFKEQCIQLGGFYSDLEIIRNGKIVEYIPKFFNLITLAARTNVLEVYFHDGVQSAASSWCAGLIAAAGYTSNPNTDTIASHAGWAEFTTYTQANRVPWGPQAAASQAIGNGATPIEWTIGTVTSGTQIAGIFIANQNTKGGTTGLLFSTATFPSGHRTINTGDTVRTNYGVTS